MKTPQAVLFGVGAFWIGLIQGAESPDSIVSQGIWVTVVIVAAAIVWEVVARWLQRRSKAKATVR